MRISESEEAASPADTSECGLGKLYWQRVNKRERTYDNDDLELLELGECGHETARYGRGDAAYWERRVSNLESNAYEGK